MRKITMTIAAAAVLAGTFGAAPAAQAGQVTTPRPDPVLNTQPSTPVQPLDCEGTTGRMGCGPGWIWRDGWRGNACYPC
jgi:hypothetical protein